MRRYTPAMLQITGHASFSYTNKSLLQKHGNDLIQLTYYGFVNVYLVREEDGFTLVDTALESCARSIVQISPCPPFPPGINPLCLESAHKLRKLGTTHLAVGQGYANGSKTLYDSCFLITNERRATVLRAHYWRQSHAQSCCTHAARHV